MHKESFFFCTRNKGNQDVKVSEKREIKMLLYCPKLDKLGLVDITPSTVELISLCPRKKYKWHMTHDSWHVTSDTVHVTFCGGWRFSKNFNSLAFMVFEKLYFNDLEEMGHLVDEWIYE